MPQTSPSNTPTIWRSQYITSKNSSLSGQLDCDARALLIVVKVLAEMLSVLLFGETPPDAVLRLKDMLQWNIMQVNRGFQKFLLHIA